MCAQAENTLCGATPLLDFTLFVQCQCGVITSVITMQMVAHSDSVWLA